MLNEVWMKVIMITHMVQFVDWLLNYSLMIINPLGSYLCFVKLLHVYKYTLSSITWVILLATGPTSISLNTLTVAVISVLQSPPLVLFHQFTVSKEAPGKTNQLILASGVTGNAYS